MPAISPFPIPLRRGIVLAATLDTKGEEVEFLRNALAAHGVSTIVIDCGVLGAPAIAADIPREAVAAAAGIDLDTLRRNRDREAAIEAMLCGLGDVLRTLLDRNLVGGYIGIGGGTNAALASIAFRLMPLGLPKLLLSTNASGQTKPIVGFKDVVLMHSVVDILGMNSFLADMLRRAAAVMAALLAVPPTPEPITGRRIAMTTFGSTTEAADHAVELLARAGCEVLSFHARGIGGEAAEAFLRDGRVDAILDLTITEIADEIVGGVGTAGPTRLTAAGERGLPQLILPGAIDMVNFGPRESVPARFDRRKFVAHTPHVTLMRTSAAENVAIARFVAERINAAAGPVAVLLPMRGFSAYDREGGPFFDPRADNAFRRELLDRVASHIPVEAIDAHINERRTMERATDLLLAMLSA